MITIEEYVGPWHASSALTEARLANARLRLLPAVCDLEKIMRLDQVNFQINPVTLCGVSGETFGGFRPQSCKIGAPHSNHKEGLAVDRYDPDGAIDAWCLRNLHQLKTCGIWLEDPGATIGWSHWQCVPPRSGNRVFLP
jgi:hypothetical protein